MFLQYGETIRHALPWGIPLWDPSHLIFFSVLYLVLGTVGAGLGLIFYKTIKDLKNEAQKDELVKNIGSEK